MTIPPGYTDRLLDADRRAMLLSRRFVLFGFGAPAILGLVVASSASSWPVALIALLTPTLFCPITYLGFTLIMTGAARARLATIMPVGSQCTVTVREHSIRTVDGRGDGEVPYSLTARVVTTPMLVVLVPRSLWQLRVRIPRAAFTPESLDWLVARVAAERRNRT